MNYIVEGRGKGGGGVEEVFRSLGLGGLPILGGFIFAGGGGGGQYPHYMPWISHSSSDCQLQIFFKKG